MSDPLTLALLRKLLQLMLRKYGYDCHECDEVDMLHCLINEIAATDFEANGVTVFNHDLMDQIDEILDMGVENE
jgi:hypothetical protein